MLQGETLPMDNKPPPQAVSPAGSRYSLDKDQKYVEWMGFSFYMAWSWARGWSFYDIRHKGQRILYELSLQEAMAHYAGTSPVQSLTTWLDGSLGLGANIVVRQRVPGGCSTYTQPNTDLTTE